VFGDPADEFAGGIFDIVLGDDPVRQPQFAGSVRIDRIAGESDFFRGSGSDDPLEWCDRVRRGDPELYFGQGQRRFLAEDEEVTVQREDEPDTDECPWAATAVGYGREVRKP